MITEIIKSGDYLAYIFAFLMGLSMLIYAVLDGYDLGVGILTRNVEDEEKDKMIASIGPFWDANETWLVLGIGILLSAFPKAYGIILSNLYLPVTLMLIGLIFRGVAFDFRAKVQAEKKKFWNHIFFIGSFLTAFMQGYMLGSYILGFEKNLLALSFSILVGISVVGGYSLMGACWLIMKSEHDLQIKAVKWAKFSLILTVIGIVLVSIATPIVSERIFAKWFSFPEFFMLAPIPVITAIVIIMAYLSLRVLPYKDDRFCWMPFSLVVSIFILCFHGLAYSFYPYIVPNMLTIVESASAKESLLMILFGVMIVLPALIFYTFFAYRIFHGKSVDLKYD